MTRAIYFDMDGVMVDLYGVEGWLDYLVDSNPYPYRVAKPLINMNLLARYLNRLQREGFHIGVVSWLSKNGTEEYNEEVTKTKRNWLETHLNSVHWDEINIIPYGTPKQTVVSMSGILFDDEEQNRKNWIGESFNETEIFKVLKSL